MKYCFATLKGLIWGSMLLAHLCFFVACVSTLYQTAPQMKESGRELAKIMGTLQQLASLREGNIPDIDVSEVANKDDLKRQLTSIRETGKPKPNAFLWRTTAWSLLISVTLGAGLLIFCWWRVKGRGIWRYLLTLALVGPYCIGSLVFAAHILTSLPEGDQPFSPTWAGWYEFNQIPLSYFLQLPVILFVVALPAWVCFARSRNLNFASIFFPERR